MDQIEARFKKVYVLPIVKHYMDSLDLLMGKKATS